MSTYSDRNAEYSYRLAHSAQSNCYEDKQKTKEIFFYFILPTLAIFAIMMAAFLIK